MTEPVHTITAKYRVVTPMFLSGADQDKAEFRLASFKGALRFWWRALAASRVENIKQLRDEEDCLFGSTRTGVSCIRLRLGKQKTTTQTMKKFARNSWESYIGYGLIDKPGQTERKYITPGSWFEVNIKLRSKEEAGIETLCRALIAMGLFGGLGSRVRNGWGSLTLLELSTGAGGGYWTAPDNKSGLESEFSKLLTMGKTIMDWTAFSSKSAFLIGEPKYSSEKAHQWLASQYQEYTKSLGKKSEREGLGLPRKKAGENANARRAGSVFLHVHQTERSEAIPVALFLPARFLENQNEPTGGWNVAGGFVSREKSA